MLLFLSISLIYFAILVYRFYYNSNVKDIDFLLFMSGWITFSMLADEIVPAPNHVMLLGLAILFCIGTLAISFAFCLKYVISKNIVHSLIIIGIASVIFGTIFVSDWSSKQDIVLQERETKNLVFSFLKKMNPHLNRKNTKILEEIARADNNIQQLHNLRKKFPQQSGIIDEKLEQWQTLRDQLNQVSEDIYQKVADAYVMYKIAEIRGKDKLTLISTELLQEANLALTNAESTRAIIENALFEAKVFEEKL